MYILDEDISYNNKLYKAILAREDSEETYLKFLQPKEKRLDCQKAHNAALEYLFDLQEDFMVIEKGLEKE